MLDVMNLDLELHTADDVIVNLCAPVAEQT